MIKPGLLHRYTAYLRHKKTGKVITRAIKFVTHRKGGISDSLFRSAVSCKLLVMGGGWHIRPGWYKIKSNSLNDDEAVLHYELVRIGHPR